MNDHLTTKQRHIALITAHTARLDMDRLDATIRSALDGGMTVNEIKEVFVHASTYLGFPSAIWGSYVAMLVVEDRASQGIVDEAGRDNSPVEDGDRLARGTRTMEQVTGHGPDEQASGVMGWNPGILQALREHLFAGIFSRDVLTMAEHELVTVVALVCHTPMETISTQSHFEVAQRHGITRAHLDDLVDLIAAEVDADTAEQARGLL